MEALNGYLFAKLSNIASKSEGPAYYLQQSDYRESLVIKRVNLWENDPALHPLLGEKVVITGTQQGDGIIYQQITSEREFVEADSERQLLVTLKLEQDTFWLGAPDQEMKLTLSVLWPYRSIWEGECPNSQLHDFWVEFAGETIWRWSDEQAFLDVITPVAIPGGSEHEFSETWRINPEVITQEGIYTAKALHIASGKQAAVDFKMRFATAG